MEGVALSVFNSRLESICDEVGTVLCRSAFSPNIKDRMDFSCAVFSEDGTLLAQAAHIPVHLGSMAYSMANIVSRFDWQPGDMVVFNDPYEGGTHLPDVTVVAAVFDPAGELSAFIANRAHHADIGADSPGSMPVSDSLAQEGMLLKPQWLIRDDVMAPDVLRLMNESIGSVGDESETMGDFRAQIAANRAGVARLEYLITEMGRRDFLNGAASINEYGRRLSRALIKEFAAARAIYRDYMDSDGFGHKQLPIEVTIKVSDQKLLIDFSGTAPQQQGNINCPISVTAAAVYYAIRCLMPRETPSCGGVYQDIELIAPAGSLLNAEYPAPVAAGNVETSSRIVDVMFGALAQIFPDRVPADSQGTMNNLAMGSVQGSARWSYYETVAGGCGAGPDAGGMTATHSHMTNTLNTPIESLELHYPLQVTRYEIRSGSGGSGQNRGGDGLRRSYRFLEPAEVTFLTERRSLSPAGRCGGKAGMCGENLFEKQRLPDKCKVEVGVGEEIELLTPGGGGWGKAD